MCHVCACTFAACGWTEQHQEESVSRNIYIYIYFTHKATFIQTYIHTYSLTFIQIHIGLFDFLFYYKKQFDILLLCIRCYTVRARSLLKSMHFLLVGCLQTTPECVCHSSLLSIGSDRIGLGWVYLSERAFQLTSCQSKQNTSFSKSKGVFVCDTRLRLLLKATLNQSLWIICTYCLTRVSVFVVLHWIFTTPFFPRLFLFVFVLSREFHVHPLSDCSAFSPGSLVRLVQTYCISIFSSHSLFQQSLPFYVFIVPQVIIYSTFQQ